MSGLKRRSAPRYPMVLSADVVELPRGARLSARASDISISGCYIDTLDPIPAGSEVRLRITDEIFETVGRAEYVRYGVGMGVLFTKMTKGEKACLEKWLANASRSSEFA